ncbi:MAG: efflux transporter, family, subunit [Paenibacillus sp.]|jgi:macrolide-specific efflux system membrane fusion protein|nr:efflux transporter, family, subunit [Paenibacillus sp.]
MRTKKTWIYIAIAIILFAVSSLLYTQSHSRPAPVNAGPAGNALKFKATKENLSNTVEVKGKSSYVKETIVYAPFSAEVTSWHVNDGAQVGKGSPLFQLDDKKLRDDIAQQSASIRKAELETKLKTAEQAAQATAGAAMAMNEGEAMQRFTGGVSKQIQEELDAVNRSLLATQLDTAKTKLAQAETVAPEAGIFLLNGAVKPQKVAEGETIGKIVDLSNLQMTTSVGEYDVFRIQPGMPVQVNIDALKQTKLTGKVEKVSKFPKAVTASDTGPAQFEVVISLVSSDQLVAGLSLTATIETDRKQNVLTVPTIAVQRDNDGYYVMLESGQSIEKRPIQVGLETADKTEVTEGLQEGDTVVLQ